MRFNRTLYRLAVSALPTKGIDAGSSGTLLKTPSAFDATVTSPKKNPVSGDSGSLAQEIMCGYAARRGLPGMAISDEYQTGTTFQLNPLFVAEMMGFPVSWTLLPFLKDEEPGNHTSHMDDGEKSQSKDSAMP